MNLDFLKKKIAGVPVVYPAAAFVGVLVFIAWKMKSADATPEGDAEATDAEDNADAPAGDADYSGLRSNGTVTVTQPGEPDAITPVENKTNETWIATGITYLIGQGYSGGTAQMALTKYLNGEQLSYSEGQLRDMVLKQYGPPPELPSSGGTAAKPAKRQITPPGYHTVQGSKDDSYNQLAQLYYGRADGEAIDLIQLKNAKLPRQGPFSKGTRVFIPKWTAPIYVTAKPGLLSLHQFAVKGKITSAQVQELNDGMKFPVKSGRRVRIG